MGYKIGLDFGTTNSTLSFINTSGSLETFRFPGLGGIDYIPSCVAYTKNKKNETIRVGREALRVAANENTEFYKDMKMVLPRPKEEWTKLGWSGDKDPEEVIAEYLEKILLSENRGSYSFKKEIGEIDGIVVSVPQVWLTKQANHLGRPKLEKIIKERLGLPMIQLISEPVSAAAYYSYWHKENFNKHFKGNLLVCDMGGGTFDITLCRLDENFVEVISNDGNGISELGKAGVYFDTKLLQLAHQRDNLDLKIGTHAYYEAYKKLQEYKVDCAQYITENIETAISHPSYTKNLPIIESPIICYMNEVQEAFKDVKDGIESVLTRFLNLDKLKKELNNEDKIQIDRIILVGGFNEFILTRDTIKNFLLENKKYISGDMLFVDEINSRMAAKAISFGATLIANEKINVEEVYPHTIGIVVEWKALKTEENSDEITLINKKNYIPLILGKKRVSSYKEANFYNDYLLAFDNHPKLTIYIKPSSGDNIAEKEIPENANITLPNFQLENRWKVGMKLDESQLAYVVFKDEIKNEESKFYELGNIFTEMFGLDGLVLCKD